MTVSGAQAVRRALDVVRTVAQLQRSGASLSRVAKATGLSTPTVHRLLRTLTEEDLLTFNAAERCYYVGRLAFELGLAVAPEARLDPKWEDAIAEVARRTRLTSYLIGRSNDEAVCLVCVQGWTAIRAMPMEIGQRVPLGFGAGSLAILASLDDDEIGRILDLHHGSRYDVFPGGRQDFDRIHHQVAETRRRGFAVSSGTVARGVVGLGVVVSQPHETTRLAVTVSAVADGFDAVEADALAAIVRDVVQGRSGRPG